MTNYLIKVDMAIAFLVLQEKLKAVGVEVQRDMVSTDKNDQLTSAYLLCFDDKIVADPTADDIMEVEELDKESEIMAVSLKSMIGVVELMQS